MSICKIEDCSAPVSARGWCKLHYKRWHATGVAERSWKCKTCDGPIERTLGAPKYCGPACRPRPRSNAKLCSVDGCALRVRAKAMCSTHYGRWMKTGRTEWLCLGCGAIVENGRVKYCGDDCKPQCSIQDCDGPVYSSKGHCKSHDRQLRNYGQVQPFAYKWAAKGALCVVCERPVPEGTGRRKCCSGACQVRLSHHDGSRSKTAECLGCGTDIILTERREGGKLRRSDAKWCDACIDQPARRRMYRYSITPERYAKAVASGCEICGRREIELHIDHDHSCCPGGYTCGECVRGFLCGSCNRAIGLLNEDANTLIAAAAYLVKSEDVLRLAATDLGGV